MADGLLAGFHKLTANLAKPSHKSKLTATPKRAVRTARNTLRRVSISDESGRIRTSGILFISFVSTKGNILKSAGRLTTADPISAESGSHCSPLTLADLS